MANPQGIGGFKPGQVGNPGGHARSESAIRLLFLRDCRNAHATIVAIMQGAQGTKAEQLRLQAADMVLNRGIGKPHQDVSMDFHLTKPLESMSEQELREFRIRYAAVVSASPKLIDEVIEADERAEPELPLGGGDDAGGAHHGVDAPDDAGAPAGADGAAAVEHAGGAVDAGAHIVGEPRIGDDDVEHDDIVDAEFNPVPKF